MNRVIVGFENMRIGLHICRGNWSQNESTLLSGSYQPLKRYLERMNVRQFVLEYATERRRSAGTISAGARAWRREPSHRKRREH